MVLGLFTTASLSKHWTIFRKEWPANIHTRKGLISRTFVDLNQKTKQFQTKIRLIQMTFKLAGARSIQLISTFSNERIKHQLFW